MNLFAGLMGGPNVTQQRPGPMRINFFREYHTTHLDSECIHPHLHSDKTYKKEIKYCCHLQH